VVFALTFEPERPLSLAFAVGEAYLAAGQGSAAQRHASFRDSVLHFSGAYPVPAEQG